MFVLRLSLSFLFTVEAHVLAYGFNSHGDSRRDDAGVFCLSGWLLHSHVHNAPPISTETHQFLGIDPATREGLRWTLPTLKDGGPYYATEAQNRFDCPM